MLIEIVGRPIGEAPEWVRDAWVGIRIPLAYKGKRILSGVGVLSGPHNMLAQLWWCLRGKMMRLDGYAVNARCAIDLLSEVHPDAARCWEENTPSLLDGRHHFVFDAEACRLLDE